jgi:hypothetical protein
LVVAIDLQKTKDSVKNYTKNLIEMLPAIIGSNGQTWLIIIPIPIPIG